MLLNFSKEKAATPLPVKRGLNNVLLNNYESVFIEDGEVTLEPIRP